MDIGPYDSARRPRPPLAFPPSEGRSGRPLDPEAIPVTSPCGLASVSPADGELTKEARPGDAGTPARARRETRLTLAAFGSGRATVVSRAEGSSQYRPVGRRRCYLVSPAATAHSASASPDGHPKFVAIGR